MNDYIAAQRRPKVRDGRQGRTLAGMSRGMRYNRQGEAKAGRTARKG